MITTWAYIKELFEPTDRVAIYLRKPGEVIQQRILAAERAWQPRFQTYLRHRNAQGADVWIGMNPLRPGTLSRSKENIAAIRRIYLDLDWEGDQTLHRILTDQLIPPPNYTLNTSPGKYQLVWNVDGFNQESAENTMRALAQVYDADPAAIDISRVLRLPGLHNKKYSSTFRIDATRGSTHIHQPQHFQLPVNTLPPAAGLSPAERRTRSARGISPSERDWSYCCHALWKADELTVESISEQLIAEIEHRARARQKSNPDYRGYAERTVRNAWFKVKNQRLLKIGTPL